jgi:hypothetical protein
MRKENGLALKGTNISRHSRCALSKHFQPQGSIFWNPDRADSVRLIRLIGFVQRV